jgi:hypothetical protein
MARADIQTTMIYVHHVPKATAADELTPAVQASTSGPDLPKLQVAVGTVDVRQ